ncbi:MAG: TRAP transporter large permease subunit [Chloroflexi bacterium]|nr:TRAP transporter large permease subunit [Chloroflexota bacterium]
MSDMTVAIILVVGLLVLLFAGIHVAWAISIVAAIGLIIVGQPLSTFAWSAWNGLYSFVLTAVPLFIFMGNILANTGINEKLYYALERWLSRLPGGLACATIGASGVFAAMSGSSVAACATFGRISFPAMEKRGYEPGLALGSIAMGAILAPLIPPSLLLIVYGVWQRISILDLFAAGIVPGVMLIALYIMYIIIRVKISPNLAPQVPSVSWKERFTVLPGVLPALVVVLGVLGVMFGGVMTPTEAAAMGAFLSLIIGLFYRRLNLQVLKASFLDTVKVCSMMFFIMIAALTLVHVFNILGLTHRMTDAMLALPIGKYGILVLFLLMYLVMGMFFDSWSMLFLTISFVFPVVVKLGFNPIWWGIIYVMAGEQSNVTPPFGLSLFILKSVVPQHSIGTVVRGSLPFLIPIYINVALLVAFPQIPLWLPGLLR